MPPNANSSPKVVVEAIAQKAQNYLLYDASGNVYGTGFTPDGTLPDQSILCTAEQSQVWQGSRVVNGAIIASPSPDAENLQRQQLAVNQQAIQAFLDQTAQSRGYTNIQSACAYASPEPIVEATDPNFSTCEKFRLEGNALKAWLSVTWATAFAYFATVTSGKNPMPTEEQAVALIPEFIWPD